MLRAALSHGQGHFQCDIQKNSFSKHFTLNENNAESLFVVYHGAAEQIS